jgi:hypothetical protein
LNKQSKKASSPKEVPSSSVKSTSQECGTQGVNEECGSSGSNHSSSGRWKRSSPDPNKMMMCRSPATMEPNGKRILSTTPSRRASQNTERVGSPGLSGYPVRAMDLSIKYI